MDKITGRSRGEDGAAASVTYSRPDRKAHPKLKDHYTWYGEVRLASTSFITSFELEIEGGSHNNIAVTKYRG